MAEGMNASDVALLSRDADGFGGGSWWAVLIILFAMMSGGWNGGRFGNAIGYENLATSNEVQRGFDNQNQLANEREILAAVSAGTAQSVAATNQTFHDLVGYFGDKYNEITRDLGNLALGQANLAAKQQECCCSQLRAIDGVNYNIAMQTNDAVQKISDKIQGLSDQITANKMEDMQNRINQLELAQAMNGVVRYPNGFVYNAGQSPFCGCGNGFGGCCNM